MYHLVNQAQKQLLMTTVHDSDFVPGAVLERVELASQLESAVGWVGYLLQASSHLQRQLEGLWNRHGCWRGHRCHWRHPSASPRPVAMSMTLLSQQRHEINHVGALIAQTYV